jgi:hypothetical protein
MSDPKQDKMMEAFVKERARIKEERKKEMAKLKESEKGQS